VQDNLRSFDAVGKVCPFFELSYFFVYGLCRFEAAAAGSLQETVFVEELVCDFDDFTELEGLSYATGKAERYFFTT